MSPTGPIYCETGHPWLFMAEPVNTITNVFIIVAAVLASLEVRRAKIGAPPGLMALLFLLFATGVGSFFWHGFRTRVALAFDALPGLLFLIVFAGLWLRALWGAWAGLAGAPALIAASSAAVYAGRLYLGPDAPRGLLFAPAFAVIAAFGLVLFVATRRRFGAAVANFGGVALASAIVAAICRSIDLSVCAIAPMGTHFLWHIMLSLAAYLGIVMLARLRGRGRSSG